MFFPVNWCFKRIINGSEDNIIQKFKFISENRNIT